MELELETVQYRSLPAKVVQYQDGAIIKRGALEVRVRGDRALDVLNYVLETAREGKPLEAIRSRFSDLDRPGIDALLRHLVDRRILVQVGEDEGADATPETAESIFFWNFNKDEMSSRDNLSEVRVAIAGVNTVSLELERAMRRSGYQNIRLIDAMPFRNTHFFTPNGGLNEAIEFGSRPLSLDEWSASLREEGVDCVIAASDHGGAHWMRNWNEMCVQSKTPFFPVYLQDMVGYIGPIVVPGETACYECLRVRQNANFESPEDERALEASAFDTQQVVGFHPCMPAAIAQFAAMELIKFHSKSLPYSRVGTLVEVNLLAPSTSNHKVLRIPNCAVCSPLRSFSAFSQGEGQSFMPGNQRSSA